MTFAILLLKLLKRIALNDSTHASTSINEDGLLELEVIAIIDGEVAPIAYLVEDATDEEVAEFERQLDLLEESMKAQAAEDAANEMKIREVLSRLTKEERELIERPLPEDDPVEVPNEGEEHY